MPDIIVQNVGTAAVAAVLAGIVAAIVIWMYRSRKKGRSAVCSCGGSCGSCGCCPMSGKCRGTDGNEKSRERGGEDCGPAA